MEKKKTEKINPYESPYFPSTNAAGMQRSESLRNVKVGKRDLQRPLQSVHARMATSRAS
jgi:hypothetical protein